VRCIFIHNVIALLFFKDIFIAFIADGGRYGTNFTVVGDHSVHYMIAMYSYNPIELSPNVDADVSLFNSTALKMVWSGLLCTSSCDC